MTDMESFASIDRIEGNFVVLEVELVRAQERAEYDFLDDDQTVFVDVPKSMTAKLGEIREGDILLVTHQDGIISNIVCKDDVEKRKRVAKLEEIMSKI